MERLNVVIERTPCSVLIIHSETTSRVVVEGPHNELVSENITINVAHNEINVRFPENLIIAANGDISINADGNQNSVRNSTIVCKEGGFTMGSGHAVQSFPLVGMVDFSKIVIKIYVSGVPNVKILKPTGTCELQAPVNDLGVVIASDGTVINPIHTPIYGDIHATFYKRTNVTLSNIMGGDLTICTGRGAVGRFFGEINNLAIESIGCKNLEIIGDVAGNYSLEEMLDAVTTHKGKVAGMFHEL